MLLRQNHIKAVHAHTRGGYDWLFRSVKAERLHVQRLKTRREGEDEIIDWLLWYDCVRRHSTLAWVSPMKFERDWLADQPRQANA